MVGVGILGDGFGDVCGLGVFGLEFEWCMMVFLFLFFGNFIIIMGYL